MSASDRFNEDLKELDEIYLEDEDSTRTSFESVSANTSVVTEDQSFMDNDDVSKCGIVEIEKSAEDLEDSISIQLMYGKDSQPCCSKLCNELIPESLAVESKRFFQEMSKEDQDLVYLSHLEFHRQHLSLEDVYNNETRKKYGERLKSKSRMDIIYLFHGVSVCRKMFCFIYDIGVKRYKNLIEHSETVGFSERKHKSKGKVSKRKSRVLSVESITRIVQFIKNFAEKFAIPLPGRMPNYRDCKVLLLPSSETKSAVYRRFTEDCLPEDKIALRTFTKIWSKYCPYISPMKPKDDLCDVCQQNSLMLQRVLKESDPDTKEAKLRIAVTHLDCAKRQREFYQKCCKMVDSKKDTTSTLVVSFDYAQNVSYPSSPQQVGSAYFKAARKCSIFGLHNEFTRIQTNYLLDEEFEIGKGPNAVISQIHNYFEMNAVKNFVLFCDNCVAQNKNNAMIHYLAWRVDSGLNESISLNFLLTGHTKFSPDRSFGLVKLEYSRSNVDYYQDFEDVVIRSSHKNFNQAVNGSKIEWRSWDTYFGGFYKRLPGKPSQFLILIFQIHFN